MLLCFRSVFVRLLLLPLAALLLALFAGTDARASCDVIPGANDVFRGALGQTDRPFASPGDFVAIAVEPGVCDAASLGFVDRPGGSSRADDYVVTLLFTPPAGPRTGVVIATDCSAVAPKLAACAAAIGGSASCIPANAPGAPIGLQVVDSLHLSFRFPNTDDLAPPLADLGTLSGPVKIVASPADAPVLPCQLATQPCASVTSGLSACIDELYRTDGTCRKTAADVDATFGNFTALPVLNDYGAMVAQSAVTPVRFTTDLAGNALLPIDWRAVLVRVSGTPYPRLVRGATGIPAFLSGPDAIRLPGPSAISAWAPNGIKLPPVFTPLTDPTETDLALFGTVDAPRAVTRIARRLPVTSRCFAGSIPGNVCTTAAQCASGERCLPLATPEYRECSAGQNAGLPCLLASDCPGAACGGTSCRGGSSAGQQCSTDAQCPGGECGPSLFDFSQRYAGGVGPVVIQPGDYGVQSQQPATLEGQTETDQLLAFVTPEGLTTTDANGDVDTVDPVLTLRSKSTGVVQAIGDGGAPGRAVARVSKPPFRFSALAAEGDLVAYLEPEQQQGQCAVPQVCDQNADGELLDTLLRVYKIGGAPVWTTPLSADADPVIDGRSLAISKGLVFFRRPEWGDAKVETVAASADESGNLLPGFGGADDVNVPAMDFTGRHICFLNGAPLVASDGDGTSSVYCRDLATGKIERETVSTSGGDPSSGSGRVATSGDGRFVIFESAASDLVIPPGNFGLFLRDRDTDGNGVFDEPGRTLTVGLDIPVPPGALGPPSEQLVTSRDGRHLFFASASAGSSIWSYDRDADGNGVFDEPGQTALTQMDVNDAGDPANGQFGPSRRPNASADGRHVAFYSFADNLVANDFNSAPDVFVHDRDTDGDGIFDEPGAIRTVRVSVGDDGLQVVGGGSIDESTSAISADGRFVTFQAAASLTPGHVSPFLQVYLYDRDADEDGVFDEPGAFSVTLVSAVSGSERSTVAGTSHSSSVSPDGRYFAFVSDAGLVGWPSTSDIATGDRYLRDRITGLVHPVGTPGLGQIPNAPTQAIAYYAKLSTYARQKAFKSRASNLVPGDGNGEPDLFVEGVPLEDGALDLTGEGALDDYVLQVLDARAPGAIPQSLGAATQISVADGNAAFLKPEPGIVRQGEDASGDGDADDQVVQLYRNRQGVTNLELAATKVALSSDIVGALESEAGMHAKLNGDPDEHDFVVAVNPVPTATAGSWTTVPLAADSLGVAGARAAFLSPEAAQGQNGTDATEDGDTADRTMQCYDAAEATLLSIKDPLCVAQGSGNLVSCGGSPTRSLAAEDFVIGDEVLAFRAREYGLCSPNPFGCGFCGPEECDLNHDGDCCDDVMLGYDFQEKRLVNSESTVVPCPFEACDPRTPYKVLGTTVRFIELEDLEGDLNGNGVTGEFLVQLFNVRAGTTATVGVATPDPKETGLPEEQFDGTDPFSDPTPAPPAGPEAPPEEGTSTVLRSNGRCVEPRTTPCTDSGQCGADEFCDAATQTCAVDHGTCASEADCPAGSNAQCRNEVTTATASDTDGDAIIDPLDDCPTVANASQLDFDHDGVGDACDLSTCGDGAVATEPGTGLPLEECDDANLADGDGCSKSCRLEPPVVCDVNADLRIDQLDVDAIFSARGQTPSGLADPRDANHDGTISVLDARKCATQCSSASCKVAGASCGLLGIEALAALGIVAALRRARRTS